MTTARVKANRLGLAWLPPLLAAALLAASGSLALGQDASSSLLNQDPFDQITLDAANDNAVIKVATIRFPGRKVPEKPKSTDKLTVKLLDTGRDYEVMWRHIAKVELFEDLLLAEMRRLTAAGNFDEAFEYLLHLRTNYPQTAGLEEAHNAFLYQSAGSAFRQGNYAEALGLLEELHRRAPRFQPSATGPTLVQVLGSSADRLIGQYVAKEDYGSARTLLERLTKKYGATNEPFAVKWREQLAEAAARQRDAAREALEREDFVAAYDAFAQMREIWPKVEGGPELAAEMAERYPLVQVGVLSSAQQAESRSLADPAARRIGRLVQRPLFQYQGMGPEGGEYTCPFGETELSDDNLQLTFRLRPSTSSNPAANGSGAAQEEASSLNAYRLSELLLPGAAASTPESGRDLRGLIKSVDVSNVWQLSVNFRRSHVLPQAAIQNALGVPPDNPLFAGPYQWLTAPTDVTRFVTAANSQPAGRGQMAEVVERVFDDPQRAVLALQRGEIDVLERVFPGDVEALKRNRDVVIDNYGVPTTHLIVIRRHNPYLANRTFRRALLYGSDRETILRDTLLGGASAPGWRVVSGPFPAPTNRGDSAAYGYDQRIEPRAYDPRLAITLRILGQREVKAVYDKGERKLPPLGKLTLAHPADETARIACRALKAQWKQIGVEVELVELPLGTFVDADQKHDLLYVQAQTAEPLIDAARLLGANGLAPSGNEFVDLCLRQIEAARNWRQVRQQFQELHRLLHEDVTIAPLWQTYDYFAYRKHLSGVGRRPAALYQHIEQWRLAPQSLGN